MPAKRKNIELNLVKNKKPKQAPNPTKLGVKNQSYQIKVGKRTFELNDTIKEDLNKFKKNMSLENFFEQLLQYSDIFTRERIENTKIRRGKIPSLMVLENIVYGIVGTSCKSDRECIKTLLGSNLLTKQNHVVVLERLSECLKTFMFDQLISSGAEATFRSDCLKIIRDAHMWATEAIMVDLKAERSFGQSMASLGVLKTQVQTKNSFEIRNIYNVPEYRYIEVMQKVFALYEKHKNRKDIDWFTAGSTLIMACTGARFVESCHVSKYELSKSSLFDPNLNVVVRGLAKKGKQSKKIYGKLLREARENKDEDRVIELSAFQDKDVLDLVPDVVLTRPILSFGIKQITPTFLVDVQASLREFIRDNVEQGSLTDLQYNTKISNSKYYSKTVKLFNTIFTRAELLKFRNRLHSYRKLYASYSWHYYGLYDKNFQSHVADVLGHSSLSASFFYSTVGVKLGVKINETDVNIINKITEMLVKLDEFEKIINQQKDEIASFKEKELTKIKSSNTNDPEKSTKKQVAVENRLGEIVSIESFDGVSFYKKYGPRKNLPKEENAKRQVKKDAFQTFAGRLLHSKFYMMGVDIKKYTNDGDMWISIGIPKDLGKVVGRQEWDNSNLATTAEQYLKLKQEFIKEFN